MTYVEAANTCVCDSNAIAVTGGCQVCAADEVAVGGKCACPMGQTKSDAGVCVLVAGLGDPCDTGAPCTDTTYSYCGVNGAGTAGTCTKRCTANADCGAAYTCATWKAQPYCRTFEGLGDSCATDANCTEDARWCDSFQTHTCVVNGCSLTDNDCPRDMHCADYSAYGLGNLCVGT